MSDSPRPSPRARATTIDPAEISHFSAHAREWWDVHGPYAPLHKMTPARIRFIKDNLPALGRQSILDIGCGGGLVCEPLSRLGAHMTGLDADADAINIARAHAQEQDLNISYRHGAAETLAAEGAQFDSVLALEIIEHVSDPAVFVYLCAQLVKQGGRVIFSTLNRTWKSYALGIVVAERVINWAPQGTHDWKKFVKPSELAHLCTQSGLTVRAVSGLAYRPLHGDFVLAPHDLSINYFLVAEKE